MLDLSFLLKLVDTLPAYRELAGDLKTGKAASVSVLEAARPYVVASLFNNLRRPVLLITAQPEHARRLYEQLLVWCGNSRVRLYPELDTLYYDRIVTDNSAELERLQVLSTLTAGSSEPPLVITSAAALMQKTVPYTDFTSTNQVVKVGAEIDPLRLIEQWQNMGYKMDSMAEVPGTMSRRGGIVDIYPPTSDLPSRLEFFGNTIDSIRLFDPSNQRSLRAVREVAVGPATELLTPLLHDKSKIETLLDIDCADCTPEVSGQFQREVSMLLDRRNLGELYFYAPFFNTDSLLSYLPENALLVLDEPLQIKKVVTDLDAEAEALRLEKLQQSELPRNFPRPYFTWKELEPRLEERQNLKLASWGAANEERRLDFTSAPGYTGQLPAFFKKSKQLLERKHRIIIISHQASRLSELLAEEDVIAAPLTEVREVPPPGSLTLVQGLLAEGFVLDNTTHLFTDSELFGFIKQQRLARKRPVSRHKLFVDIKPGDFVVHIEHGIAKFMGVTMLSNDSVRKEYLVLQYASSDKLYVPTDQIDRVTRYIGGGDQPPTLSRLGTQEWRRTKQKVEKAAEEVARELLQLYASREVVPGFAFSPDTVWQQELEASFPYVETPDQLEVQQDVKADMEKSKPMDRLVCGDVGYGKTEIAIRAAFKAVMSGKQVAVLVPTTVLAQQHYRTFSERFSAFPLKVEVLSRFRTPREQQAILEGLADGTVDICIGTHRLIQKDVVFKDLGLLIIDEEQRFGVQHKEYLKKMRREVHVLTLSATPIPRTLHMSLVGVRDMSTMETPPEERLPIKTYVAEYDDHLVREAILRELERNGQVFFVHNRVESIDIMASKLRQLVPEARISVGHGRMHEDELERVMTDFALGKSDVLVCTTIIESGLDMPNANTLIINRADKFGLTQLYQLRGRVGRGANLAYAYFLYDKERKLTDVAQKRLSTIFEATELGAGYGVAMKDLEIRGAGTLLGTRQSGHISAVGFNLYTQLLAEAVEKMKARRSGEEEKLKSSRLPPPTIDLPFRAFIPEEYIYDVDTRLSLYQTLVKVAQPEKVAALAQEFKDRFGPLPAEVENLLYAVKIRTLAAKAGIESITTDGGELLLRRFSGMHWDKQKLSPFLKDGVRVGLTQLHLNPKRLEERWRDVLEGVLKAA